MVDLLLRIRLLRGWVCLPEALVELRRLTPATIFCGLSPTRPLRGNPGGVEVTVGAGVRVGAGAGVGVGVGAGVGVGRLLPSTVSSQPSNPHPSLHHRGVQRRTSIHPGPRGDAQVAI